MGATGLVCLPTLLEASRPCLPIYFLNPGLCLFPNPPVDKSSRNDKSFWLLNTTVLCRMSPSSADKASGRHPHILPNMPFFKACSAPAWQLSCGSSSPCTWPHTVLHAQPAHTNSQVATAAILDWSGWKSVPVLGSFHTYVLHVTPWCCAGLAWGWGLMGWKDSIHMLGPQPLR